MLKLAGLLCCWLITVVIAVCALAYAGLLVPSEGVAAFTAALTGSGEWSDFTAVLDTDPLLWPTLSYKVFSSITVFLIVVHLVRWGIRKHIMGIQEEHHEGGQKQARALLKSAQKKIIDVGFAQLEETLDSVIKGAVRDAINADPWAPRSLAKARTRLPSLHQLHQQHQQHHPLRARCSTRCGTRSGRTSSTRSTRTTCSPNSRPRSRPVT